MYSAIFFDPGSSDVPLVDPDDRIPHVHGALDVHPEKRTVVTHDVDIAVHFPADLHRGGIAWPDAYPGNNPPAISDDLYKRLTVGGCPGCHPFCQIIKRCRFDVITALKTIAAENNRYAEPQRRGPGIGHAVHRPDIPAVMNPDYNDSTVVKQLLLEQGRLFHERSVLQRTDIFQLVSVEIEGGLVRDDGVEAAGNGGLHR